MNIHRVKPVRTKTGIYAITNKTNKKYLRVDFNDSCGYCGDHNKYCGGHNYYHVEHFAPKEKFPNLATTYENLIYSCPYCNLSKSDFWVGETSEEAVVNGIGFIDPCSDDYDKCLYRETTGEIAYFEDSTEGEFIYEKLNLFLERHKYCYNMERLFRIGERIKQSLDEKEEAGIEFTSRDLEKEEIYNKIATRFFSEFIVFQSQNK